MGFRSFWPGKWFRRGGGHIDIGSMEVGKIPISSFESDVDDVGESRYQKHSGLARRIADAQNVDEMSIDAADDSNEQA